MKKHNKISEITIPQPCHEQWSQMIDVSDGRFCHSCQKTVTDFTVMSNQQIIDYLSSSKNVCGRISSQQFNSVNYQLSYPDLPKANLWKRLMLAVSLLTATQYVSGQTVPVQAGITQFEPSYVLGKVIKPQEAKYRTITGKITDEQGEALPGVNIMADHIKAYSDVNGEFTMQVPIKIKKIRFSYIGFDMQEIKISKTEARPIKIALKQSTMMLGGLGAIKKPSMLQKIYQHHIVEPFKKLIG